MRGVCGGKNMIQMASLRIDTAVKPASYLRVILYASLASAMILLAWLASLSLWQYVLILVISAVIVSYLALSRPILLHISQPPLKQRIDENWQLLVRKARGDELWQARLSAVHCYQRLIVFNFVVVEPYQRAFSTTIFRDQVSAEQWRELNILVTVFPTKIP